MNVGTIYRTVLNWNTGLTVVVCNICEARHTAGALFTHHSHCSQYGLPRPPRRFKEITKIITYKVAAEITDQGTLIIP